jgi:hypothetical protein
VVLHYGQGRFPLLDSLPEVVYRAEDLYLSRQWGISTEEWMGHRRTVAEAVVLAELGEAVHESLMEGPNAAARVPVLALVDGSLIYWFLEALPGEARDRILPPILDAWERLRRQGIPLVGYLSASRSGEAMNFLRFAACPFLQPDCQTHCSSDEGSPADRAPCGRFLPLRDATVLGHRTGPRRTQPLLAQHGQHSRPLRRPPGVLLLPQRRPRGGAGRGTPLGDDRWGTVRKRSAHGANPGAEGYGYPVTLAEAHNQAVVRGGDRSRFFALLEQEMIRAGLKNVGTSYKEARKRGSIA